MSKYESRHVIFRSFSLAFWWDSEADSDKAFIMHWQGPKHWHDDLSAACRIWVKNGGYAGLDILEYLDMLNIGRNILKDEPSKAQI